MWNGMQADFETGDGRTVRACKFTGQNLTGNVKPCRAIGRQIESPCFQPIQKLALVLAQHVGEVQRHTVARNDSELVPAWLQTQPAPCGFVVKFNRRHNSSASLSTVPAF